jgi:SAM-dependent methyltransferase
VADSDPLTPFYEETYSRDPAASARGASWRALGAVGKADHVLTLCERAGLAPQRTLEVGCGDGAVLSALHARGFGGRLAGVEIARGAVEIARSRAEIDTVELYDGEHLAMGDGAYELGVLCHVLEHVREPARLLAEVARVCGAVVVEVPLENNLSARRPAGRAHSAEVGHVQRFSRDAMHELVGRAGLRLAGELEDPLPLEVHRFFARSRLAQCGARVKWSAREGLHSLAPPLARRLFTLHYACLCLPGDEEARDPAGRASEAMDARPEVL